MKKIFFLESVPQEWNDRSEVKDLKDTLVNYPKFKLEENQKLELRRGHFIVNSDTVYTNENICQFIISEKYSETGSKNTPIGPLFILE